MTEHGTLEHELRATDEVALREFLGFAVRLTAVFAAVQAVNGGALLIAPYGRSRGVGSVVVPAP